MKDCLMLDNLDVQEWIDKEGINTTYEEYLKKGYLPDYKDWTGKEVSTDTAKDILNSFFGLDTFNVQVKDFSNLMYSLPANTAAAYLQQVIYLNQNPQKADVYEEGFHAIMDVVISADEKKEVLKAGQSVLRARLKSEGKTINQYIKELVTKYPTIYGRLSAEKALERAFEEEVASMFVDSFENKNYLKQEFDLSKKLSPFFGDNAKSIAKILSKIFKFFKDIYNKFLGNQDTLSLFFQNIKDGKFKNNNKVIDSNGDNNIVPFTRLLELYTTRFNRISKKETQFLSHSLTSEATQRVIRNVGAIFFQLEGAKLFNTVAERMDESIDLYFKLEEDFKEIDLNSEVNATALEGLKEDVKEYIEVFSSIVDFDSDTVENEEETPNDFAKFDSSANESSTFENSFSKQLKLRIGKTGRVKTIHNYDYKGEGTIYPIKLIESVNVLNVYYSFARTLGNTSSDKERWNRLYAFSNLKGNPDAKAFVDTLLFDLFHSHERMEEHVGKEFHVIVEEIKKLYVAKVAGFNIFPENGITISSTNAMIINSILKGFDLWKRSEYILKVNTISRQTELFDANLESIKNSQYKTWVNSLQEIFNVDAKNKDNKQYVEVEQIKWENPETTQSFNDLLNRLKSYFGNLNIQLSDEYLKYSILSPMVDSKREIVFENDPALRSLFTNFKIPNNALLTPDTTAQINTRVKRFMVAGDINNVTNFKQGMVRYLKSIAEGNGYFDERIPDNTFKGADGKTKYNYQNKTYFLQKIDEILKNPTKALTYKTLIGKQLNEETQQYENIYLKEGFEFISDNYLLKKFANEYKAAIDAGDIFSFSANGLRQSDSYTDMATMQTVTTESDGLSVGDMSTRDFAIYLLSAAVTKKESAAATTPIYVGNFEASKTFEFVNLPFIKGLFTGEKVSTVAIDLVKKEFEKEFNRIVRYAKNINTTKYDKYNSSSIAKITYGTDTLKDFFYIPFTLKNGKKQVNFSAFRSMQFSDHVGNLIDDVHYNLSQEDQDKINSILNDASSDTTEFTTKDFTLQDNLLTKALLGKPFDVSNEIVETGINNVLNGTLDYIKEEGIIDNQNNLLLDNSYEKANTNFEFKDNALQGNIKKILLSNMLNTMFLNQLLHGDQALLYKNDMVDMFKRFKGRNAAINSMNTSTIAPELGIDKVWESMEVIVHDEIKGISSIDGKPIDKADAQNHTTVNYMRYAMYSLSRLTRDYSQLFDIIEQGEPISAKLEKKIFDLSLYIPVLKTVFADGYTFFKKSDFMLTKQLTSLMNPITKEFAETQGDFINGRWKHKIGATVETVRWSDGSYYEVVPRPEKNTTKEPLHDRRKAMEGWRFANDGWSYSGREIMLSMPISASKMLNLNTLKGSDLKSDKIEGSIRTIDLKYYGLQVESSHPHDKIPHFSQYIEIALNELNKAGTTKFTIDKQGYTGSQLLRLYQDGLVARDQIKIEELLNELFDKDNDGVFKEKEFRNRFAKSLETSGADKQTIELVTKGYSLNHPLIKEKFIAQIFSHFTKDGLSQKIAGDSAPHVSSYGMKLIKQVISVPLNGKEEITWRVLEVDSQEYFDAVNSKTEEQWNEVDFGDLLFYPDIEGNKISSSHGKKALKIALTKIGVGAFFIDDLRHFKPRIEEGKLTGYFDEVVLPKFNINQKGISKKEKYMFSVRIPSQDKHSGVNVEWVHMLPAYHGSLAVVPKEIVQLSGHDFDVDKAFIHKVDGYYEKGIFVPYSNDLKSVIAYNLANHRELKQYIKDNPTTTILEAFKKFGLPTTEVEFNSYKKKYGGYSNRGYINNLLLQAQQQALANVETMDGKIADTPASLTYLDTVLKEFPLGTVETNITPKYLLSDDGKTFVAGIKKKFNVHSMFAHIITHRNTTTGKKNIGPDVNWNLLDIVLNRLDVQINPKNAVMVEINGKQESFDSLQLFLNHKMENGGEFLRVFDVLSTMISAATDEAKEQLNARYGLTIDALNAILPFVAMGGNLSIGIALVNQPVIKEFLAFKAKKNYAVLTKKETGYKYFNNEKIIEEMFKSQDAYEIIKASELVFSIDDLAKGLRPKQYAESTKEIKMAMLRDFLKLSEITEYGNNVVGAIKLKKGLSTDIYAFNDTLEKLAKIQYEPGSTEDTSPFFIKEEIKNNPLAKEIKGKIEIVERINEALPKLLAIKSPIFEALRASIKTQAKENWNNVELKELDSELESFIYSQMLYKSLEEAGNYDALLLKYLKSGLTDPTDDNNIVNVFTKFKTAIANDPTLNNNSLIKKLELLTESGTSFLKLNQLVKLNDNQMTDLADAFTFLANRPFSINEGISPLELTKALQALYIIKDGMQFKYTGITKIFPVEVFTRMSENIEKVIKNGEDVKELFTTATFNEFQRRYFESVKHKSSSKTITIYDVKGKNDEYLFELDKITGASLAIYTEQKGSGITVDKKGNLLRYITLKIGKDSYSMKLISNDGLTSVYNEYKPLGTSNSTLMGLPIENNVFVSTDRKEVSLPSDSEKLVVFEGNINFTEINNNQDGQRTKGQDKINQRLLSDSERRNIDRLSSIRNKEMETQALSGIILYADSNKKGIISKTNKEGNIKVFKVDSSESLLSVIQQKLNDRNTLNGKIFAELKRVADTKLVVDNNGHFIYVTGDNMYINPKAMFEHLKTENGENYLDTLLFEELIHIITNQLITFQEKIKLTKDQLKKDSAFVTKVANVYPTKNSYEAYFEYIRVMVQQELIGTTTLKERITWDETAIKIFNELMEFIFSVIETRNTKKLIKKHVNYINEIKNQSNQEQQSDTELKICEGNK